MVKVSKSTQVFVINVLISLFLLSGFLGHSKTEEKDTKSKKLKKFNSCKELYKKLAESISLSQYNRYRWYGPAKDLLGPEEISILSALRNSTSSVIKTPIHQQQTQTVKDYSKTNIQVEGVDEADIVKTDGNYIYVVSTDRVAIIKAYPTNEAKLLSIIPFSESEKPLELFIEKDKLLTISSKYQHGYYLKSRRGMPSYSYNLLITRIYDISDRSKPSLIRKVQFEGNYTSSRKIGSFVYLILNYQPNYVYINERQVYEVTPESAIPQIIDTNPNKKSKSSPICSCRNIKYIDPIQTTNFLILASISLDNPTFHIQKEVVLGASDTIYASLNNVYVANNFYESAGPTATIHQNITQIYKFSVQNGKISYKGTGKVPGKPINQFAMDEQGDFFRIATQTYGSHGTASNVYVLNNNLTTIGRLENLAITENMHSARFFNNRLYMVTFKRIDPLFVIDLQNPTEPKVLGELKIPGFSEYLHPIDENYIIGFGKDTVDTPKEWATQGDIKGLKIAVFDVSDPKNPKQKFTETIGDSGSNSPALEDHRAFLFDREKELLVFPAFIVEDKNTQKTFNGAYVYNLNLRNGFTLKGRISHYDEEEIPQYNYYNYNSSFSIKRALYIENVLYTISTKKVSLNKLDNLTKITEIGF